MDLLYGSDEKFGDLDDSDMSELLESDVFPTSANMVSWDVMTKYTTARGLPYGY